MIHRWSDDDGAMWTVVRYPSPISRSIPSWVTKLNDEAIGGKNGKHFFNLLHEIYETVRGRQYRLAAMGIRALLEQVMIEKVGDLGSFSKILDAFQTKGYVALIQRETLENILEAGHATMHRFFVPREEDLGVLLDVTEVVLQGVFVHLSASANVADRVPPRQTRPKSNG